MRSKTEYGRRWSSLPFRPSYEVLLDELLEHTSAERAFQEAMARDEIPPIWKNHESVQEALREGTEPPRPYVLYVDGV